MVFVFVWQHHLVLVIRSQLREGIFHSSLTHCQRRDPIKRILLKALFVIAFLVPWTLSMASISAPIDDGLINDQSVPCPRKACVIRDRRSRYSMIAGERPAGDFSLLFLFEDVFVPNLFGFQTDLRPRLNPLAPIRIEKVGDFDSKFE